MRAIEEGVGAGYPKGAGAVLLIELDGPREEIEAQSARIEPICRDHAGARDPRRRRTRPSARCSGRGARRPRAWSAA